MSQLEWPRLGKHIGSVNDLDMDQDPESEGHRSHSTIGDDLFVVARCQSRRVYGDEIELDKDRIDETVVNHKYLCAFQASTVFDCDNQEKHMKLHKIIMSRVKSRIGNFNLTK